MRILKQRKFSICQHYLPGLVNGEVEGVELERFIVRHRLYNVVYDVIGEDPHFARCDVSGLFGDCFEVNVIWLGV